MRQYTQSSRDLIDYDYWMPVRLFRRSYGTAAPIQTEVLQTMSVGQSLLLGFLDDRHDLPHQDIFYLRVSNVVVRILLKLSGGRKRLSSS